jgi:peptide/nickel transport system ATP-binding protein
VTVLEVRQLTKHFPVAGGMIHALDDVSLRVRSGETLGLVGESGSGKSTLGRCALRLMPPTAGEVLFDGRNLAALGKGELRRLRRSMQIVFQDPFASLNPRMRIASILAEPFEIHERLSRGEIRGRVRDLLREVGLPEDALGRYPHEFSGGQRQRIGIARAVALRPKFIVADEPVSALDVSVGAQIVNLLADLQQQLGLTYLFISHSLPLIRHVSTRIAVMYLGRIVEIGPAEAIFGRPMHPYTRLLHASTPGAGHDAGPPKDAVATEPPSAIRPPSGCRFRTRCPLAEARCAEETPALRELAAGHFAACHFAERLR